MMLALAISTCDENFKLHRLLKTEIANIRLNTAFPKEGVFIAGQDKVFIAKDEVFIEEGHLSQLSEILTALKSIISQRENWRTKEGLETNRLIPTKMRKMLGLKTMLMTERKAFRGER